MTDTASAAHTGWADPVRALADYRAGDFFITTQRHTMLASGAAVELTGAALDTLDDGDAFSDAPTPIAVGVLPFSATEHSPARLVIPADLRVTGPAYGPVSQLAPRPVGSPSSVTAVPAPQAHMAAVRRALDELRDGDLRKVVLARALDIAFDAGIDPADVLHNLVAENPDGYTFAAGLPGGGTLVGSSPELLVRRTGTRVLSHPHAGSSPRSADPVLDNENARALLASAKDRVEHAVVVEAVVEALRPYCTKLDVPGSPTLSATPAVWHLGTEITGELRDPEVSAFRLACALHPTPAVCGTPTEPARAWLAELEPFDREYYAGAIGWVDAAGDGEWAVAIRCAQVSGNAMRLYSGGGIVAASDPRAELDETSAKFRTLLRAMGLNLEV